MFLKLSPQKGFFGHNFSPQLSAERTGVWWENLQCFTLCNKTLSWLEIYFEIRAHIAKTLGGISEDGFHLLVFFMCHLPIISTFAMLVTLLQFTEGLMPTKAPVLLIRIMSACSPCTTTAVYSNVLYNMLFFFFFSFFLIFTPSKKRPSRVLPIGLRWLLHAV